MVSLVKTKLSNLWYAFRSSYWFVPALMASGAIGLAWAMLTLDTSVDAQVLDSNEWLYSGGPEGARTLLSTIAGSMITVAGVTFSITIVALTLASSQLGPRLLRNFMRDVGNQVVLGTFIATFIYCLLVLRTVRSSDYGVFVPHLAVTGGLVLALASLGVLIYFIHHVSVLMQAEQVIAAVGRDLLAAITWLFPEHSGHGASEPGPGEMPNPLAAASDRQECPVTSTRSGYIQAIDLDGLLRLAVDHDLHLRLPHRPGHFLTQGATLVVAWPSERLDAALAEQLNDTFVLGTQRTPEQDVEFAMQQLVEIALRALSPGINDPFTAITCVDWLGATLSLLTTRQFPSPYCYDAQGTLRLLTPPVTFAGLTATAFHQIRRAARSNVAVTLRLLEIIAVIAGHSPQNDQRAALRQHASMIAQGAQESVQAERDRTDIEVCYQAALKALEAPDAPEAALGQDW